MNDQFKSIKAIEQSERRNRRNNKEIKEFIINTLIMIAIALVAGGVLGFVHELTKEPIATMAAREKQAANSKVFESAASFSETILDESLDLSEFEALYPGVDITDCIQALDDNGNALGYVFEVTSHEGYGGDIVFSAGINNDGSLNGIFITSISETAGLGMRAGDVLVPQIHNLDVDHIVFTKTGKTSSNEIDAISGATITTTAFVGCVNAALDVSEELFPMEGGAA